jgi:hypothetical protein
MELLSIGRSSRQAFEIALGHVSRAKSAISAMKVVGPDGEAVGEVAVGEVEVTGLESVVQDASDSFTEAKAPPRVRSRGRPRQSRFKSPVESPGASKRKQVKPAVDNGRFPKKRGTDEELQEAEGSQKRRCKLCGDFGHYRSTCGRKSTYKAHA